MGATSVTTSGSNGEAIWIVINGLIWCVKSLSYDKSMGHGE